jgi:hypothetical protein
MAKRRPDKDEEREERITMEIVVDCYNAEEQATGWHCYMDEKLQFPFKATCTAIRDVSPLKVGEEVEVIGKPSDDDGHDMLVKVRRGKDWIAVPLAQLEPAKGTYEETKQAVGDWRYWVEMGYRF